MRIFAAVGGLLLALSAGGGASSVDVVNLVGLGTLRVTFLSLDFGPPGGGAGTVLVTKGTGGYSAAVGTVGLIADLDLTLLNAGVPLPTPVDPFVSLPGTGTRFMFNLERIRIGSGAPCVPAPVVGQSCTPSEQVPNSPLLLTQGVTGVGVQMTMDGTVTDLVDSTTTPYVAVFRMNLVNGAYNTVPKVIASLSSPLGLGYVQSSWSAQLVAQGSEMAANSRGATGQLSGVPIYGVSRPYPTRNGMTTD